MAELDLDVLAVEPLVVKVGGKSYSMAITVKGMMAIDKARRENAEEDVWPMMAAMAEAAGLPTAVFETLSADQGSRLIEEITRRFFPTVAGAGQEGTPSPGATPSEASSEPTADSVSTES